MLTMTFTLNALIDQLNSHITNHLHTLDLTEADWSAEGQRISDLHN